MRINRKTAVIIFGAEDAVLGPPPKLDGPHSPIDKESISFSDVLIGCITVIFALCIPLAVVLVATEAYGSGYLKKTEVVPCKWEIKVEKHCEPFNRPVNCEWRPVEKAKCKPDLSKIGPANLLNKGLQVPRGLQKEGNLSPRNISPTPVKKDGYHKCPPAMENKSNLTIKRYRCPVP